MNGGTFLPITTRCGRIFPEPYPVVHQKMNDIVSEAEVIANDGEQRNNLAKFDNLECIR